MSDSIQTNEPLIKPFPAVLLLHYLGSYLLPVLVYVLVMLYINVVNTSELLQLLASPVSGFCIIGMNIIVPIILYNRHTKKIREYDGTDESARVTNKCIRDCEKIHLIWTFFNILFFIAGPLISAKELGIDLAVLPLVFDTIGCVALFGFLPMIFFVSGFEEHLSNVRFKKAEITSSFVVRNIMIIALAAIGTLAFSIAPIFVPANIQMPLAALFFGKILPCSLVAIAMGVIDTTILQLSVRKKLRPITDLMKELANKNFSHDILHVSGRDEIGYFKQNVNEFYDETRVLLGQISDAIEVSRKSAMTLATGMTETASSITQITANIKSINNRVESQTAGVEKADVAMASITGKISLLLRSVDRQSDDITTSSSAVEEMVANIRSVTDILLKNSAAVNQLTEASDTGRAKVEQAVERARQILEESSGLLEASDIIQNIAEQTNLLAMNAAIEAAHAGEAGKGFAVVSDEIRKLAEQSNTQGKTISAQLEQLQQSIADITEATKEVQEQFSIIFTLAETVRNQETVVEHAMQEQSAGSAQVLDAIKGMKESTMILENGAGELEKGSKEINSEMRILAQVTDEVNGAMGEISSGITGILSSVNEINRSSDINRENLDRLDGEISKFNFSK